MKLKPKFFIVELPLYNIDICVSFLQDQTSMIRSLRKNYNIATSDEEIKKGFIDAAGGVMGDFGIAGPLLIRINQSDDLIRTITHEVFHAVVFITTSRGLTLGKDSEEAFAYLIGHLNSEIISNVCKILK